LYELDELYVSPSGRPKYKQRPTEGVPLQDIWAFQPGTEGALYGSRSSIDADVRWLTNEAEKLGYPTQKPLGLLERIISASSNPGDVVLDPFCGCGTAVHAAQKLGRQWIGIDVTYLAIGLIERRLKEAFPGIAFEVVGEPKGRMDAEHLAETEPHQFQYWITQKIGGQPYQGGRKGADRGIDGYIYYTATSDTDAGSAKQQTRAAIISVKAGRNVGVAMVRDLKGVMDREKADIGIFVCVVNPTREMEREAAAAGIWTDPGTKIDYPRLQLFTLAELFQGRQPRVPLLDRQAGFRKAKREDSAKQGQLI
jgi:site-specific DNA-methyltransferase (adenine-specific)